MYPEEGQNMKTDPKFGLFKIAHDFSYSVMGQENRRQTLRQELARLKDVGYAGVVVNVRGDEYLENEEHWDELRYILKTADEMGLRLWIYDEKGYPSGLAGGLTLRNHPEWAAKGLVCVCRYGKDVRIEHPVGHLEPVCAVAYPAKTLKEIRPETGVDVSHCITADGGVVWQGDREMLVCLVVRTIAFEMTHSAQNLSSVQMYVDLMDREAVGEFIRNTYEAYYAHVGEFFDGRIEAFFTDEPSYMAPYIDNDVSADCKGQDRLPISWTNGSVPVVHQPNPAKEILPTAIWTNGLQKEFAARRGYDVTRYLPALFGGENAMAAKVRQDFYLTCSELYAENFFGQLSEWCTAHNTIFSGHILLEDDIKYHPMYEGNYFANFAYTSIPGIDMLVGTPETVRRDILTPKLMSSIAHLRGHQRVMDEANHLMEGIRKQTKPMEALLCGAAMEYACGVTDMQSYYAEDLHGDEFRRFTAMCSRLNALQQNARHRAEVLLYYPIESLWAYTFPDTVDIRARRFHEKFERTSYSFMHLSDSLLKCQADYDIADEDALCRMKLEDGALVNENGERFTCLVMPWLNVVSENLMARLETMEKAGIMIVWDMEYTDLYWANHAKDLIDPALDFENKPCVTGRTGEDDEGICRRLENLMARCEVVLSADDAARIAAENTGKFHMTTYRPYVVATCWEKEDGSHLLFVINGEKKGRKLDICCELPGDAVKIDPVTGEETALLRRDDIIRVEARAYDAFVIRLGGTKV